MILKKEKKKRKKKKRKNIKLMPISPTFYNITLIMDDDWIPAPNELNDAC